MRLLDAFRRPRRSARPDGSPLAVGPGDVVGVVLLASGGPSRPEDVEPFLLNRYSDPALTTVPLPAFVRRIVCRLRARRRAAHLIRAYELIGGRSPLAQHTDEQRRLLGGRLADRLGSATGASFRTYTAMRHWHPSTDEAVASMAADGVTHVVLLPMGPHPSSTASGASFARWADVAGRASTPAWPTASVREFATHPRYVQALAERVDEGLQRFPREVRDRVPVLFCAQGDIHREADRYCCHIHATVQAVGEARAAADPGRPMHVAFGEPLVRGRALAPQVREALAALADDGHDAVLVVPVSFVTDRIETAYDLDVVVRAQAAEAGLRQFEVSRGLNGHPLLVEALVDCVASTLTPAVSGDGAAATLAAPDPAPARAYACPTCGRGAAPASWSRLPATAPLREAA